MLWHPDKFSNDEEKCKAAHSRFIRIAEAYELLKDYEPTKIKQPKKLAETHFQSATTTKTERANITRIRVKSSNVFAIGYDKVTNIRTPYLIA